MISREELASRFTYHSPKGNQSDSYQAIRSSAHEFAIMIVDFTPVSREQSLALTHLEETVFWANAAIARREESTS